MTNKDYIQDVSSWSGMTFSNVIVTNDGFNFNVAHDLDTLKHLWNDIQKIIKHKIYMDEEEKA